MPGHHGLQPRGSFDPRRGQHPDLDDNGNFRPEAFMDADHREFYELRQNPAKWQAFMSGVAARQAREHPDVQRWVSGQEYPGPDTLEAFKNYQADIASAREFHGHENEVTADQVREMTNEQYDAVFDEHGRPRPGYTYRPTDRDLVLDSQAVERFSRDENLRQSRDWR